MQSAGGEYKASQPAWTEGVRIADHHVHVVVMLLGSGRRQRGLLHQGVARDVVVDSGAKEPLRLGGLRPVETCGGQIVAEWDGDIRGHGDRACAWDESG